MIRSRKRPVLLIHQQAFVVRIGEVALERPWARRHQMERTDSNTGCRPAARYRAHDAAAGLHNHFRRLSRRAYRFIDPTFGWPRPFVPGFACEDAVELMHA